MPPLVMAPDHQVAVPVRWSRCGGEMEGLWAAGGALADGNAAQESWKRPVEELAGHMG
jgi:hypothetical protein